MLWMVVAAGCAEYDWNWRVIRDESVCVAQTYESELVAGDADDAKVLELCL